MTGQSDWYTSFFFDFFGELQLAQQSEEQSKAEVDALERLLGLSEPRRILDVPCGAGRHSLELARRGHRVTGVDFNPQVLEAARSSAARLGLEPDLRRADMRELEFEAEFECALCHWGSFGYFDDRENAEFLRRVARALTPGGSFFLDTHVAETLLPKFTERDWGYWGNPAEQRRLLQQRRFDCDSGRVESTWTLLHEGRERTEHLSIRIYTYRELRTMLEAAGFSRFQAFDNSQTPFKLGSSRLWLLAHKSA